MHIPRAFSSPPKALLCLLALGCDATGVVRVFPDPAAAVSFDDELAQLLEAYVRAPDRSLIRIRFSVSSAAFAEGGCERIALALAPGTPAGSRQLELQGGTRALLGGLMVEVPPGTAIERRHLGDHGTPSESEGSAASRRLSRRPLAGH